MRMKHICFFSGDITNSGGTEKVASIIANELSKNKNYKVSFVSLVEKSETPFFNIDNSIKRYKIYYRVRTMAYNTKIIRYISIYKGNETLSFLSYFYHL